MREIGGYIEFEHFHESMLHDDGIKLNCGRSGLAYLIEAKEIRKIAIPFFDCDTVGATCRKYGLSIRYYRIGIDFLPVDDFRDSDEWIYIINYYGQLTKEWIQQFAAEHPKIIIDNAQAYFDEPTEGIDTIYTCRKFFGVSDGGILYSDRKLERELPMDESYSRMRFLLGRFERTASEFYSEYVSNNEFFDNEPIKRMSKLTENILHGLDYESIKNRRTDNFSYLNEHLRDINLLNVNNVEGAFMYPLMVKNGDKIRKELQQMHIYIPTLWPDVFSLCERDSVEYRMADNILPLPVDQRYEVMDMQYIMDSTFQLIRRKRYDF